MTWRDIASKDIHDAGRSLTVWLLLALLVVAAVGYAALHSYLGDSTFPAFVGGLTGVLGATLPILGLLVGYKSVVHERTSGSLFLTLSMPHSRRDFLFGKLVGRSAVLLGPTLVAVVVAGIVGAVRYGTEGVLLYPWFLFATLLYGLAFVGIAVALSMWTTVDRWITFGAFGSYFLLVSLWDNLHSLTLLILHRFDSDVLSNIPDWALLFRLAGPGEAYDRLVHAGFDVNLATQYASDAAPLYVDWWMGVLILLAWFAVPLALSFWRFSAADL